MVDIEKSSVSMLEDRLSYIDRLETHINTRDKIPIWDGAVYVYLDSSRSKTKFIKAVPIQLKGDTSANIKRNTTYYSIDIDDLKAFLSSDGVIYFVVGIDSKTRTKVIYYRCLLPFEIKKLLSSTKAKQKTKNVQLKKFPDNDEDILDIFLNFIRDSNKQKNIVNSDILSLTELKSKEQIKYLEFGYTTSKNLDDICIFDNEFYLYAVNSVKISYPVGIIKIEQMQQNFSQKIFCNGKQYYDSLSAIIDKDKKTIKLGKGIFFTLVEDDLNFTFIPEGSVLERLNDVEFIIDLINTKEAFIDNEIFIKFSQDFYLDINLEDLYKYKNFLQNLNIAIKLLGISGDKLSFEELEKNNAYFAKLLITAIVEKKLVQLETNAEKDISFGLLKIGDVQILILAQRVRDQYFAIENFFTADMATSITSYNGEEYPSSRYIYLNKEHFLNASNINYDDLFKSITTVSLSNNHYYRTTMLLLEMIKAFDVNYSQSLLDAIKKLAIWLKENATTENDLHTAIINLAQINKRPNSFDEKDKVKLLELLSANIDIKYKAACYILLDMYESADELINLLSKEEAYLFKQYPIYNLVKH